jgi:signal transduction histidine kinase
MRPSAPAAESRRPLSPGLVMLCAAVVCLVAAGLAVGMATSLPWIGLRLAADGEAVAIVSVAPGGPAAALDGTTGARLAAIGTGAGELALTASDVIEEPDGLESYATSAAFMQRQTRLAGMLGGGQARLRVAGAAGEARTVTVAPAPRPLLTLPPVFWVQLVSGLGGFFIGAWVWSMRRGDLAARMFALSGVGLMVSALPAAVYSTRGLAIDGGTFAWMAALNHIGAHLFGGAMIALFLNYPRRLARPAWLLLLPATLVPWVGADIAHLMPDPTTGMYVPMLAEMAAIVVLVMVQRRLARAEPATLAALRWLGLSVVIGAGAFVAGIAVPQLLGVESAISQGYAFGFFLLVYVGIALGIRRYRLFDLGDWAFRILFYTVGAILLLLLDTALIWALQIERGPALGVSLLIVGFAYLPMRDVVWRRMYGKRLLPEHEMFAAAMDVAFGLTRSERADRWRGLLARMYDPLEMAPATLQPEAAVADPDGLALTVPAVADSAALRLRYPFGGKGIFGPPDLQLANQLVALVGQAESSRDAYERGVLEERQRIARDLHDDLGARLLAGLHSGDARTRPLLQAALAEVRTIVSGLAGEQASLDSVLAEARHESTWRLEAAGIAVDWPLPDECEGVMLDYRQSKALVSSIREVLSNIIRHAQASLVRAEIALVGATLTVRIGDNGRGMPTVMEGRGYGLKSVRGRIEDIGGRLSIVSASGGTTVEMTVPLAAAPGPSAP